jgi:hypothetical protein
LAGHYLKTINPEAAAAIGQERTGDMPEIGDWVLYYPTPGEMPGGTDRFPMQVMQVGKDGMVFGIAKAGISDERDVRAFRRSVENPTRAWDWPHRQPRQGQQEAAPDLDVARAINVMDSELTEYRGKLEEVIKQSNELEKKLNETILDTDRVEEQLDLDADRIGRRLERLEQELGLDDKPKPQRVATPPARAVPKPAAKSKRKSKR